MEKVIWLDLFFYNAEAVWTAILFCGLLIPLCMQTNLKKLFYAAVVTTIVLLLVGLGIGIYNLITAPRCSICGQLLAAEWPYAECPVCHPIRQSQTVLWYETISLFKGASYGKE